MSSETKVCYQCGSEVPAELKARGDNGPQHVEANPRCGIPDDLSFCSETCFFDWEDTVDEQSGTPCPEYCTEESMLQNGEFCVPGDIHCQLTEGHDGPHQHTHTFEWTSG